MVVPVVKGLHYGIYQGGVSFYIGEFFLQFLYGCLPSLLRFGVGTDENMVGFKI